MNDELLDEIARFMLRKDSDFMRLDMAGLNRQHIQKLVEQQRREELAISQSIQVYEEKPAADSKSLGSRFKHLMKLNKKPADK